MKTRQIISTIIIILLAALFIYAAINKLVIYKTFTIQLEESPITKSFAHILSWLVPTIEIIIAILLLYYRTRLIALYSSFFLMLGFTIYIYVLIHFTTHVPCGCGGIISKLTWIQHLWFNAFFTLLAGIGVCVLPTFDSHVSTPEINNNNLK